MPLSVEAVEGLAHHRLVVITHQVVAVRVAVVVDDHQVLVVLIEPGQKILTESADEDQGVVVRGLATIEARLRKHQPGADRQAVFLGRRPDPPVDLGEVGRGPAILVGQENQDPAPL